jgi:hypothetical protein
MSQQPPPDFNFDTTVGKDNSASKQPEPQSGAKKLLSSLSATAGAAATIVARQTERTKLTTITIPAAYRALGKDCVQQKRHLEGVTDLIQQLRSVIGELKALTDAATAQPATQSLTDKAKAAGKQTADFARQKQLGMRRDALIADIGKAIYDQQGDASGPAELVTPIRDALSRISTSRCRYFTALRSRERIAPDSQEVAHRWRNCGSVARRSDGDDGGIVDVRRKVQRFRIKFSANQEARIECHGSSINRHRRQRPESSGME